MEYAMKILFIVPHLSTGGMPQYLYRLIQDLPSDCEPYVIEHKNLSKNYIVHRDRIKELIGNRLITFWGYNDSEDRDNSLVNELKRIQPDIVHFQEFPEIWLNDKTAQRIYCQGRKYKIIETTHDSGFDPQDKRFYPDGFSFVSDFHVGLYQHTNIPCAVNEFPVEYKERPKRNETLHRLGVNPNFCHILNVGLFSPRKNQGEIFSYARKLIDHRVIFHFVGNQAYNFAPYWFPLMKTIPPNCVIWGERSDVEIFYSCMDMFLFTSKGTDQDRETNPLVLKEALGWHMPIYMYNLSVYQGKYDDCTQVKFLTDDFNTNVEMLSSFFPATF